MIATRIAQTSRTDFDCYATVDGIEEYIGSAKTRAGAEKLCRDYRYSA
jgi:hypothetical protein